MSKLLKVSNLNISIDHKPLVQNVSFSIANGKTLCVVGESGSGKSLSALSVIGLLPDSLQQEGEIIFDGQAMHDLDEERKRKQRGAAIGMIFQEPLSALNPVLTVGEQVAEVFEIHTKLSRKEIEKKVISLFKKVKIKDAERRVHAYPHQLSGGQRQRVMIAMSLALKPKLLIADEPTTALDATVQGEILKLIKDLQKEMNMAVMFITHDFGVVEQMADHVAVMQHGKLVEQGTVKSVMTRPKSKYTKHLLATMPKMNTAKKAQVKAENILEIKELQKTFMVKEAGFFSAKKPFDALKNISLAIRKGEVLGLVGESGCGKSTLAKCILRLYQPDGGKIFFSNHDVTSAKGRELKGVRRHVQMVFQDPFSSLNPRMKIGESVGEGIRAYGLMNKAERMDFVENLLEDCGLPKGSYHRYPHQFSGGQRQRICIARALALKPALIVADEPVSALDVSVQKQILDLMEELKKKHNLSYLFISHDLRVISQFCDRVVVMKGGKIIEEAETSKLLKNPKKPYTKSLLNAVPGA